MELTVNITKGTRIRARWLDTKFVSLAGAQIKAEGQYREVTGVVRHVRGDHPTNPTEIRLFVEADGGVLCPKCNVHEVMIDPKHVVEVL
jgi:hypothetical protein